MQIRTRTRGASAVGLGNAFVATSVAGMLVAGPRVLSAGQFAGLGVAWTVTTIFGFGLAVPFEQVWTRRVAAGVRRGSAACWTLAAAAVVVFVALASWANRSPVTSAFPAFTLSVGLGLAGWVAASHVRSSLAGRGELGRYAVTLAVEALTRLVLIASALLAPDGIWLLAASVGAPLFAAAAAGLGGHRPRSRNPYERTSALEVPYVIGAAFGYQMCISGIPLLLSFLGAAPASLIGAFVLANSYLRVPTVLGSGFVTETLVREGGVLSGRQLARSGHVHRDAVTATGVATVVAVPLLLLSGPVLEQLLGHPHGLNVLVLVSLTTSSVAAVWAAVLTAFFVGSGRAQVAVVAWGLGSLATVTLVAAAGRPLGVGLALGVLVGPLLSLTVLSGVAYGGQRGRR